MNHIQTIDKRHEMLFNEWEFHINAFNALHDKNTQLWHNLIRVRNADFHLFQYKYSLYDIWVDETDQEKARELQVKMDKITNKMFVMKRRAELMRFEHDVAECITNIHHNIRTKFSKKLKMLHHIKPENTSNCKIVHITKMKIQQLEKEDCCICLEPHKLKEIVTSSCGHTYGKTCFEHIVKKRLNSDKEPICPLCRSEVSKFAIYRKR